MKTLAKMVTPGLELAINVMAAAVVILPVVHAFLIRG